MQTTEEAVDEVLEHYGVKGMKWGVRKARGSDSKGRSRFDPDFQKEEGRTKLHDTANVVAGVLVPVVSPIAVPAAIRLGRAGARQARADKADAQDSKFERKANSVKTMVDIHNRSIDSLNREQAKINKKYDGVNLTDPKNAAKARKYEQETADMMAREYQKTANATKSKSGRLQYDVELRGNNTIALKAKKIKHAAEDEVELILKAVLFPSGHIKDWELDEIAQGEDFSDSLMHYGVKGMKWGVRRATTSVTAEKGQSFIGKTKVRTSGGTGQPATADAVKVAKQKQKLRKSGVAAMTSKELKEMTERLRLEQQAVELAAPKGKQAVKKILGQQGKQAVNEGLQEATRRVKKKS